MRSILTRNMVLSIVALWGGVVSIAAHAATDYCGLVKPEELSKALGETFEPPQRVSTPSGPLAGTGTRCTYKGASLEVTIASVESLTAAKNLQGYEIRRSRELAKNHAVDLTGLGDNAFYTSGNGINKIDSRQGTHDYTFVVQTSAMGHKKDWKDPLMSIATLFYSRLK